MLLFSVVIRGEVSHQCPTGQLGTPSAGVTAIGGDEFPSTGLDRPQGKDSATLTAPVAFSERATHS